MAESILLIAELQLAFVLPDEKFQLGAAEDDCVGAASLRRRQLARALDQEGAGLGAVDVEGELPLDDVVVYAGLGGRRGRHHDLITVDADGHARELFPTSRIGY